MRTITIVMGTDGGLQFFIGGEIPAQMAADACRAVARALERRAIEEEIRENLTPEPSPLAPLPPKAAGEGNGGS